AEVARAEELLQTDDIRAVARGRARALDRLREVLPRVLAAAHLHEAERDRPLLRRARHREGLLAVSNGGRNRGATNGVGSWRGEGGGGGGGGGGEGRGRRSWRKGGGRSESGRAAGGGGGERGRKRRFRGGRAMSGGGAHAVRRATTSRPGSASSSSPWRHRRA